MDLLTPEEKIEKMQNYLRREIIDQGYDPEEFTNFLKEIKGESGTDLKSWTIEELYYVVPQYKESRTLKNNSSYTNFDSYFNEEILEKKETENTKSKTIKDVILYCKTIKKNELFDKKNELKVIISNPEIIKSGAFSFAHLEYTLTCDLLNTSCKRSLTDFEWLKCKLRLFYPNLYIPALPKEKKFSNKNNEKKIIKNLFYLQSFINELINNDILRTSDLFFNFISLSLYNYQMEKNIIEKTLPPKGLSEIKTIDGIVRIGIVPSVDRRAYEIKNDINKKMLLLKKLSFQIKDLMSQFDIMKDKYLQLALVFEELNNLYSSSKVIIKDKMCENFDKLTNIFKAYSEGYSKQKIFYNNEIKNYFNYMKKELVQFEQMYTTYNGARTTYIDITDKKNYEKNEEFLEFERYFGYLLNVTIKEYENLHYNHYLRIKQHFTELSQKNEDYVSSYNNFMRLVNFT